MKITEEVVDYVSQLSRLKLDDGQREEMAKELDRIVTYMEKLEEVDTQGVEPMSHVLPIANVLRPDRVEPSVDREALLQGAPKRDAETFLVPRAVD